MYSENLLRETEKEMQEIDAKKKIDFIKGVALMEKKALLDSGKDELTEEEKKQISKEEYDNLNKPSTIALRNQRKKMEGMKLEATQEMLLKKLIFFESIDKCKNEDPELKYNMYNLFFGMKP